ncbi:hypothetical protein SDC9_84861 [bioreactor metagenome]|uniref:Uncharacterized protein n=1 Tax=bioreactor metagenome TaxID=1076179 RepID=A0A644ZBG6_9ZZZZ
MRLIWATRGRTWGFRFLLDGGFPDPLPVFEEAFSGMPDDLEAWQRTGSNSRLRYGSEGATTALRFRDPLDRRDRAGRVIPQEFVVLGDDAWRIDSVETGRLLVWPEVEDRFAGLWDLPEPPPVKE